MATDSTDVDLFHEFLSSQNSGRFGSLEEAVGECRRYQQELAEARINVQIGIDQANCGECKLLDIDEVVLEVRDRLSSQGITD